MILARQQRVANLVERLVGPFRLVLGRALDPYGGTRVILAEPLAHAPTKERRQSGLGVTLHGPPGSLARARAEVVREEGVDVRRLYLGAGEFHEALSDHVEHSVVFDLGCYGEPFSFDVVAPERSDCCRHRVARRSGLELDERLV